MKLTNILSFFQRNPFYLILLIIFILLTIYQEVLKERAKHPENKEKNGLQIFQSLPQTKQLVLFLENPGKKSIIVKRPTKVMFSYVRRLELEKRQRLPFQASVPSAKKLQEMKAIIPVSSLIFPAISSLTVIFRTN